MSVFDKFVHDESGTTAIEYGLLAGLVAVAIITALTALGVSLDGLFLAVGGEIDDAATPL